ncbi:MAG: class I SAM-dependent methyltransferase, partial [Bdellovibrionales bacterium]|nr:class I SAM-dependent methyltransferase [Bdellovibrionales bacterium]
MNDTAVREFEKRKWWEGVQSSTADCYSGTTLSSLPATALQRFSQHGMFGLAESYQDGIWKVPHLANFLYEVLKTPEPSSLRFPWLTAAVHFSRQFLLNPQSGRDAFNIAKKHYDLGNELFETMLDSSMTYTSGLWNDAESLDEAQQNKLRRIAELLQLKSGMRILDIGCGWGNFAEFAAREYGVTVKGVTVSKEQAQYARTITENLPVEIVLSDYRNINGEF